MKSSAYLTLNKKLSIIPLILIENSYVKSYNLGQNFSLVDKTLNYRLFHRQYCEIYSFK